MFDSCDDLLDYYQTHALEMVGPWGLDGGPIMYFAEEALDAAPTSTAAAIDTSGGSANRVSGTNNQVAGVDEADIVIDLCTPEADAMVTLPNLDTPVGPGSTLAYVAIVNSLKVRIAQLLTEQGVTPPVITRASVVGAERSRALFESAYREHARRVARTIVREPDDEPVSQA